MSDIVIRLKNVHAFITKSTGVDSDWIIEAADTITRLRDELDLSQKAVDVLESNARQQAKLLADTGRELDQERGMVEILRKGIQNYLDGDYKCPRSYRPGKCPHGLYYYNDCENCIDDHFEALLKSPKPVKAVTLKMADPEPDLFAILHEEHRRG